MVDNTSIGFICAAIAVLSFGSNFVVTKSYRTGDGMFFQFVLCCGIFTAGLIYQFILCSTLGSCPQFEPLAAMGGVVWCLGNSLTVSIIKTLGLGMGLLIWGLANMVMGWATGFFGLYGLTKNTVSDPTLNAAGIGVAVLAMAVFSFVKPSLDDSKKGGGAGGKGKGANGLLDEEDDGGAYAGLYSSQVELGLVGKPLLKGGVNGDGDAAGAGADDEESSWTDSLTDGQKKTYGVCASIVAGLCYGNNFGPPQYIVDNISQFPGAPTDLKDYVFPHFCGIWLTSLVLLLVYCVAKKGKPVLYPEVIAPGWLSGMIWATAQISWFFANQYLQVVVAFPLISIGPGLIGALWGVLVFGEIKGRANLAVLGVAFVIVGVATALIVVSK